MASSALLALESLEHVSGASLIDRINAGVKASAFNNLAHAIDIPMKVLAMSLGLSARTIRTRKKLTADETERAYRAYRVLKRATDVLGDEVAAQRWMVTKQRALGERTPLSMLVRDVGTHEVLNVLSAIEDGGYL